MLRAIPSMHKHAKQHGGITILVALMLLVFLTIVAVGMSRNSFREVVISGTTRQGAQVRNVADSGIEWGIFWLVSANGNTAGSGSTAESLTQLKIALLSDASFSGRPYDAALATPTAYDVTAPPNPPSDLSFPAINGMTPGYSIALTRMGKMPLQDTSQGSGSGAYAPAQGNENKTAPNLWAIRSDAQLASGLLGNTFVHSKEAWITTPVE